MILFFFLLRIQVYRSCFFRVKIIKRHERIRSRAHTRTHTHIYNTPSVRRRLQYIRTLSSSASSIELGPAVSFCNAVAFGEPSCHTFNFLKKLVRQHTTCLYVQNKGQPILCFSFTFVMLIKRKRYQPETPFAIHPAAICPKT